MPDEVISTHALTRYFGSRRAVDAVSLTIPRGCVFGLLGRNGSGKTTLVRMLLGLLEPTRGSAAVLGHDSRALPPALLARIGYLPEGHPVYGWMRVREHGEFQRRFYPRWNDAVYQTVVRYFQLDPAARVGTLSRGERAGLSLALALAPEPELLVLDDPALGLDPVARRALLEAMVYVTRGEGRTILFTSHLAGDVERVADRIAVLDRGRLRACCTLEWFRRQVRRVVLRFAGPAPATAAVPGLLRGLRTDRELVLTIANFDGRTEATLRELGPARMDEVPLDLEEAFISYLDQGAERSFLATTPGGAA
jgi:ABC-2 type transport system ATP-binding protein